MASKPSPDAVSTLTLMADLEEAKLGSMDSTDSMAMSAMCLKMRRPESCQ